MTVNTAKTIWAYVDTSKEVGDANHLKLFPSLEVAEDGSRSIQFMTIKGTLKDAGGANKFLWELIFLEALHRIQSSTT
jgi:hypothetical protein